MEIYITSFAGLLSTLLLVIVYIADRYEPEPVQLIQNSFLSGALAQLLVILAISGFIGAVSWSGPWLLITVVGGAIFLPYQLHKHAEMDERFDGIVYSVAFLGGAVCTIHLNNLPGVVAASSYGTALAPGAAPDLRDLLILASSTEISNELGGGLVVILAASLMGAVLGTLQLRGFSPWRTAAACVAVAVASVGLDLVAGGVWPVRLLLLVVAIVIAVLIKSRSVFRDRPEARERDLLVMGAKTVLMVFGAALLTTVVLRAAIDGPRFHSGERDHSHQSSGPAPGSGP